MRVTAPVAASLRLTSACLIRCVAIPPVDDLQCRREHFGVHCEEATQRDRKRQHPLAHRHFGDDVIDQPGGSFRHAPRPARGANAAPLARKGHPLLVAALRAAHSQEAVRKNSAFEKRVELVFDKLRHARRIPGFDFGEGRIPSRGAPARRADASCVHHRSGAPTRGHAPPPQGGLGEGHDH